jgi:hypothetical protein
LLYSIHSTTVVSVMFFFCFCSRLVQFSVQKI